MASLLLKISLDLIPKGRGTHLAVASIWAWLKIWWIREAWGAGLNISLDSVWSKGINCYSYIKILIAGLEDSPTISPWQLKLLQHSSQALNRVGCFSGLPFPKPQSSVEEWLRMLTWSRNQLPTSCLVQCRNQELNLCRHPATHGAVQGSECGCWSHPTLLTETLQLLLLALTYTLLCINQNNFLLEAQKFQRRNCCFYP